MLIGRRRSQSGSCAKAKKITLIKKSLFFIGTASFFKAINDDFSVFSPFSSKAKTWMNPIGRRGLSINLGGGKCKWEPPTYDVPDDIDFYKTLIAGYPSGGKRLTYIQMEALTGWPAKDEWEFEYVGMSNHPFIKTNYPHHDGIWGWGDVADQVVLMVQNIRRSMVEFHDIMWDLGYATTWQQAIANEDNLYMSSAPMDDFLEWRDWRLIEELHWYGWFIDYWMEGGLQRDIFTHKITTSEHFKMLIAPGGLTPQELAYSAVIGDQVVTPSYDILCGEGHVSGGCEPVAVISSDKLVNYIDGPAETTKIAETLMNNPEISQFLVDKEAWDCIWDELIMQRKGAVTVLDRPGYSKEGYNFSEEMLEEMIHELDRLIAKYGSNEWNTKTTANRLVELFTEHRGLIQTELDEVNSGQRKLADSDFLGPKERQRRRQLRLQEEEGDDGDDAVKDPISDDDTMHGENDEDHMKFFSALERALTKQRREKMKIEALSRSHIGE